jgi:hypothetical protein
VHVGRVARRRSAGRDRTAVGATALDDRVAIGLDRKAGGLEEHHHQRDVLGLARVRVALDPLLGGLLDPLDLVQEPQASAREVVPAARVERELGAGEVGVAVVKAAGGA